MPQTRHHEALPLRPEEAVGLLFFVLLCVMSVAEESPLFEPLRASHLTLAMAGFVGVLLVASLGWLAWGWLSGLRRKTAPSRSGLVRVLAVVRDWLPAVICLGIYESLKHLHLGQIVAALGISPKDDLMIRIDETLFRGHPSVWMQAIISRPLTFVMKAVYDVGYYVYPAAVGLFLYLRRPRHAFRELVLAFLACAYIGYMMYCLVPVAGPRFSSVAHLYTVSIGQASGLEAMRYQYDCFPSLHTAIPLTVLWIAFRHSRRLGFALLPFVLATVMSTLYLRMHYGIDVLAGMTLVPLAVFIGVRADAWWEGLRRWVAARAGGQRQTVRRVAWAALTLAAVLWFASALS